MPQSINGSPLSRSQRVPPHRPTASRQRSTPHRQAGVWHLSTPTTAATTTTTYSPIPDRLLYATPERNRGTGDKYGGLKISQCSSALNAAPPSFMQYCWPEQVAMVRSRLERGMNAAEAVMASPNTATAMSDVGTAPLQALEAIQLYRTCCMASLLELDAIGRLAPIRAVSEEAQRSERSAATVDRLQKEGEMHGMVSSPVPKTIPPQTESEAIPEQLARKLMDAYGIIEGLIQQQKDNTSEYALLKAQLVSSQRDTAALRTQYAALETTLIEVLHKNGNAEQQAYFDECHRDQHRLWAQAMLSTQSLMDQEHSEWQLLLSFLPYTTALAQRCEQRRAAPSKPYAMRLSTPPPLLAKPLPPSPATQRYSTDSEEEIVKLSTYNAVLLRQLQAKDAAAGRMEHEAVLHERRVLERAIARLRARHEAEVAVWKRRLSAAEKEALLWKEHHKTFSQSATDAAEADALRTELRDREKMLWRLQLSNDHLEAKATVRERELDELRCSRSPLRNVKVTSASRASNGSLAFPQTTETHRGLTPHRLSPSDVHHSSTAPGINPLIWLGYEERSITSSTTPTNRGGHVAPSPYAPPRSPRGISVGDSDTNGDVEVEGEEVGHSPHGSTPRKRTKGVDHEEWEPTSKKNGEIPVSTTLERLEGVRREVQLRLRRLQMEQQQVAANQEDPSSSFSLSPMAVADMVHTPSPGMRCRSTAKSSPSSIRIATIDASKRGTAENVDIDLASYGSKISQQEAKLVSCLATIDQRIDAARLARRRQ